MLKVHDEFDIDKRPINFHMCLETLTIALTEIPNGYVKKKTV